MEASGQMNTITPNKLPKGKSQPAPDNDQAAAGRLSPAEVVALLESNETSRARIARLVSCAEFAKELGVCSHTIRRMERRGLIRAFRINARLIRYPASELERLLKEASV